MNRFDIEAEKPYKIRTQPFTYVIFGVLIGPTVVAWSYIAYSHPAGSNWVGAAIAGGILAAIWIWFSCLEVDLYSDHLAIKTVLGKRQVAYSEIRKVDLIARSSRGATGRAWAIYDNAHFASRPLKVPTGPFRVGDQRKIAQTLVEKALAARIDSCIRSTTFSGK